MARPLLHAPPNSYAGSTDTYTKAVDADSDTNAETANAYANAETANTDAYSDADSSAGNYHQPRRRQHRLRHGDV